MFTGEPGLLISKVPDDLLNKKLYKAHTKETEKKFIRNVFVPGDVYMNYGDSFVLDKEHFVYFHDRLGDTFRFAHFITAHLSINQEFYSCTMTHKMQKQAQFYTSNLHRMLRFFWGGFRLVGVLSFLMYFLFFCSQSHRHK